MTLKTWIAAALIGALPASGALAQAHLSEDHAATLQAGLIATADGFILPGYQTLARDALAMHHAIRNYCDGDGGLELVKDAYADSFLAWQRISIVQVGPVMEAEGPMRFQLWPDPKGFSRRAIRAVLNAEDRAVLEEGALEGRSIALVNLAALEDLVYGELQPGSYACDLADAISLYQAALADDIANAWMPGAPFRTDYDTAISGNARYADVDAVVREMLAGVVVYIDTLRKKKILRGLGDVTGEARAERTEATASGLGLASVAASFTSLSDFYQVPGGLFDVTPAMGGSNDFYLLGGIAGEVGAELAAIDQSMTEIADEDGAAAQELRDLVPILSFHDAYLKEVLPASIGMVAGFTSADGD